VDAFIPLCVLAQIVLWFLRGSDLQKRFVLFNTKKDKQKTRHDTGLKIEGRFNSGLHLGTR